MRAIQNSQVMIFPVSNIGRDYRNMYTGRIEK